jgi:hypothetical protein
MVRWRKVVLTVNVSCIFSNTSVEIFSCLEVTIGSTLSAIKALRTCHSSSTCLWIGQGPSHSSEESRRPDIKASMISSRGFVDAVLIMVCKPLRVAPLTSNGSAPGWEPLLVRGATRKGLHTMISTASTKPLEEIMDAHLDSAPGWELPSVPIADTKKGN